jgi:hypothetical protein
MDDDLMCGTCHRPLDTITDLQGNLVDFWHASALSIGPRHDPVPVPRVEAQAVVICDFCSNPEAGWRYPAKTFDSPDLGLVDTAAERAFKSNFGILTPRSVEDWCACDTCHDDIEHGRWDAIVNRATRGTPKEIRRELKDHIRRLHRQFLANRTGPAAPLRRPHD